jgi:hypothetical protein
MALAARQVKKALIFLLLAFVVLCVLMVAEQILIKQLDRRAIWQDEEFKAYLAKPGPRNYDSLVAYDCQYRPIGWIYRYRICVIEGGDYLPPGKQSYEDAFFLIVVGAKSVFSPVPERNADREIWDSTLIWYLDSDLRKIGDQRKGLEQ